MPASWYLKDQRQYLDILFDDGTKHGRGLTLYIGSTSLRFWAPRQGAARGSGMTRKPFTTDDMATARLIAAAPDLLAVAEGAWHLCMSILADRNGATDDLIRSIADGLQAVIKQAKEGTRG